MEWYEWYGDGDAAHGESWPAHEYDVKVKLTWLERCELTKGGFYCYNFKDNAYWYSRKSWRSNQAEVVRTVNKYRNVNFFSHICIKNKANDNSQQAHLLSYLLPAHEITINLYRILHVFSVPFNHVGLLGAYIVNSRSECDNEIWRRWAPLQQHVSWVRTTLTMISIV